MYQGSLLLTFIISLFDGLNRAGIRFSSINNFFHEILPLYDVGLGWIIPAIVGGFIGFSSSIIRVKFGLNHPTGIVKRKKIS